MKHILRRDDWESTSARCEETRRSDELYGTRPVTIAWVYKIADNRTLRQVRNVLRSFNIPSYTQHSLIETQASFSCGNDGNRL
ncbi:hypothetical protein TNCV_3091061 [Trichonephila clavipes]|uniref:Uncharacterized protein n=1 Tax=Trichonephila clavipes TaxID=2585209 RepID=A0A8X7BH07_TRICX|nr:hypothetical protein TNCV_3091061 [Trichonephila clavipes]